MKHNPIPNDGDDVGLLHLSAKLQSYLTLTYLKVVNTRPRHTPRESLQVYTPIVPIQGDLVR